jgi:hypothetical protein
MSFAQSESLQPQCIRCADISSHLIDMIDQAESKSLLLSQQLRNSLMRRMMKVMHVILIERN